MTSVANLTINASLTEDLKQDFDLIGKSLTVSTITTENVNVTGEYLIDEIPVVQLDHADPPSNFLTGGNNADLQDAGVTGVNNTSAGFNTLADLSSGSNNVALGYGSGQNITTGAGNTFLGATSGVVCTSGSNNICIGKGANLASASDSSSLVIASDGQTGVGPNTATIDPAFFGGTGGGTSDATNGRFLSHNFSTGQVSSTKSISFPYNIPVTGGPVILSLSETKVPSGTTGTCNDRIGIVYFQDISSALGSNTSVTLTVNNSSITSTGQYVLASILSSGNTLGSSSDTYGLHISKCASVAGGIEFIISNLADVTTTADWQVTIYFQILN